MSKWEKVPLSEIAIIERSGIQAEMIKNGTIYIGLEHIEKGGRFTEIKSVDKGDLASSKFQFTEEHILYGKLRPYLAKIACPDFKGICSTDILPILPTSNINRKFLFHFLSQPKMVDYANSQAVGVNLPRLSPSVLAKFEIPLAPIEEQKRIAEILDRTQSLISKRKEAIALLDTLTQSIFLEMFGDPVTNPKEWDESKTLGEVADIVSGITKGRKLNGQGVREISYLAVVNVQDHKLDLSVIKTIEATENEIERYRLQLNDLVLTEGGDPDKLGRGTIWHGELPECIHQNHIFRVRIKLNELHPRFLMWLIGSKRGKSYFLKSAKQTTGIASINMSQLKGFPVFIPPLPLQKEFAQRVEAVEKLKAIHHASLSELQALFASLQHRAFRGEL